MVVGVRALAVALTLLAAACGLACGGDAPPDFFATDTPDAGAVADAAGAASDAGLDGGREAGGPLAYFSAAGVDFGLAECAGTAPPDQSITVANLGAAPLTWSATLAGSRAIAFNGAREGTLAPGARGAITIAAEAFPRATVAGVALEATLTVVTSDPAHPKTEMPVKVTPAGGTLVLAPAAVSFGQVPLRERAPDLPLLLANPGNRAIDVTIAAPSDPTFTLSWSGPRVVTLAPGGAVPSLVAGFTPTAARRVTATAAIGVRGVTCGVAVPSVSLSGEGTNGVVALTPGALFFGEVSCGSAGVAQTITLANAGNGPFDFTTALDLSGASPYLVSPARGTVAPGASVDLRVKPASIPQRSLTTSDLYADVLTVTTTSAGDAPHRVALHETAKGARLRLSRTTIAFGDVPIATADRESLFVLNDGNAPASVTVTARGAGFDVAPSVATPTPAGGSLEASVTFRPTDVGVSSGSVSLATTDTLCAALPDSVALSGAGTKGEVSLSTQALDFQSVACGTRAAPKTVRVQNTGNAAFRWTAAFATSGAPYALDVAAGQLAPGDAAVLTVTPDPIPSVSSIATGLYDDALVLRTDIPSAAPVLVRLLESARGAILDFDLVALPFGDTPVTTTRALDVRLTNRGNSPATVTLGPTSGPFAVTPSSATVEPPPNGPPIALEATFAPGASVGPAAASLALATGDPLCAPLPALPMSGTGRGGLLGLSPDPSTPLDFGVDDCGTAGSPQSIAITNNGNAPLAVTPSLAASPARYTLSPAGATAVAPGATLSLIVTPALIALPASVAPNALGDTLTLATDIPGDRPHAFTLLRSARGAILSYDTAHLFGPTAVGATSTPFDVVVTNTGNVAANVLFAPVPGSRFAFATDSIALPAGATASDAAAYTPLTAGAHDVESVAVSAPGAVLCRALPGPLSFSGDALP